MIFPSKPMVEYSRTFFAGRIETTRMQKYLLYIMVSVRLRLSPQALDHQS